MPHDQQRFEYLLAKYTGRTCSEEELKELLTYVRDEHYKAQLFAFMDSRYQNPVADAGGDDVDWDAMYQGIVERRQQRKIISWRSIAAAAAVLVMMSVAVYLWMAPSGRSDESQSSVNIVPGNSKAVLTLEDGSTIVLDELKAGRVALQQNSEVSKTGSGQLRYQPSGATRVTGSDVSYNTISTPKGGEYQVVLPDGTRVWLNAASSLKFPTSFTGTARNVELSGEAYFEVAKNVSKPFIVKAQRMTVQVLGTHFNVMAYNDEPGWKTTLLEGSVKVKLGTTENMLRPGQQANAQTDGSLRVRQADTENAVAWKNGYFSFSRTDLKSIMRQIARWYDVEIEYVGSIPDDEYVGEIKRGADVREVLRVLELSNVRFEIKGRKIIVLP